MFSKYQTYFQLYYFPSKREAIIKDVLKLDPKEVNVNNKMMTTYAWVFSFIALFLSFGLGQIVLSLVLCILYFIFAPLLFAYSIKNLK